ncbi:ABC transporter substrate-binding protein [Arthrobacter koreensis]|uniref:ABC transporter substrate-binding protein n=1 Tax=Arthrobacter koreensis TaxID=199136 RepID=UPI002DBC74B8|nr:ABC transporter substrate-binding protein [Arthrobacter koreensis]MEB7447676.1 ABC transporter substrate-binding protein [Arthrobacter koreensis]
MNTPRSRRLFAGAALSLAGVLAVSACGNSAGSDKAAADSVSVGSIVSTSAINPLMSYYGTWLLAAYEPLVTVDRATGEGQPSLAESWEIAEDNLTWSFKLREGVTFHDGSEFTAEDVVFSLTTIKEKGYQPATYLTQVESVTALGDYEVQIVTSEPTPLLLSQLSLAYIAPSDAWTEEGFNSAGAGTGPYEISGFDAGQSITLTANEDYWGEAPATPNVTLRTFSDQTSLQSAFEAGEVDIAHQLGPNAIQVLGGNYDVSTEWGGSLNFFQFNADKGAFANPELRRAANLAIDAEALTASMTAGAGEPEDGQLALEGVTGYSPDITRPEFDPEEAKKIVEAEGATGTEITITGQSSQNKNLYEAMGQMLEAAGFKVNLNLVEIADWVVQARGTTDADILYRGLSFNGIYDIDRGFTTISRMNSSEEWAALYGATRNEMDSQKREELLIKASEYVNEQNLALWTFAAPAVGAVQDGVEGVDFSTGLSLYLTDITKTS